MAAAAAEKAVETISEGALDFNMTRQTDWQFNLNKLINDHKESEFDWGTWDCGVFAAAIADAVLEDSEDYLLPFAGKYTTAMGSLRALKKAGYDSLRHYLVHCFGEPIGPSHAWRGDIAFYEDCAGVNLGSYNLLLGIKAIGIDAVEQEKFVPIPRLEVQEYFKVR